MSPPLRIALVGFMGCGKTTVGRLLAERIGYRFVDLDDLIEEQAGKKIAEIFRGQGEDSFRALESQCLKSLEEASQIVVAAGGGAPLREENRLFFLRRAFTFYLEVTLETALARTGPGPSRPLLGQEPEALQRMFRSRLPVYEAVGRLVSVEGKSPEEIVDEMIAEMAATSGPRGHDRNA